MSILVLTEHAEGLMTIRDIKVFTLTGLSAEPEFRFIVSVAGCKEHIQVYMSILQDGEIITRMYSNGLDLTLEREAKDILDVKLQRVILRLMPFLNFENNEARPVCSQ